MIVYSGLLFGPLCKDWQTAFLLRCISCFRGPCFRHGGVYHKERKQTYTVTSIEHASRYFLS